MQPPPMAGHPPSTQPADLQRMPGMPGMPSPQHQPYPGMPTLANHNQSSNMMADSRYPRFPQSPHSSSHDSTRPVAPPSLQRQPTASLPVQTPPSRSMGSYFRRTSSNQSASPSPSPVSTQVRPATQRPTSSVSGPTTGRLPMPPPPNSAPAMAHHAQPTVPPQGPAPYFLQGSSQADHASPSQSHRADDCPGCRADYESALKASEASAWEESRLREQMSREEEEHWQAVRASEEEEERQRREEEEQMRLVMEASRRDEEEAQQRRLKKQREEESHRQILMEESRQSAMREDEERVRRDHAELLERSRREAEEVSRLRRQEEERMREMEAVVMESSRREMEEEWRRRDEEERAMEEFSRRGGKQGEAAYWQHLCHDQAYDLAVEMNRSMSLRNEGASSSRNPRRPLPPTPGLAALAAGVESPSERESQDVEAEWEHGDDGMRDDASDGEDPFSDQAEAPPGYDEVRTDRPPEAPQSIPDHVRFAPPVQSTNLADSNTVQMPTHRPEKTASVAPSSSAHSTPRASLQGLPAVSNQQSPTISRSHTGNPAVQTKPTHSPQVSDAGEHTASVAVPSDQALANDMRSPVDSTDDQSTASSERQQSGDWSRRSSTSTQLSTQPSAEASASTASLLQQRAMKGTDFGYSNEPFSPRLSMDVTEGGKKHFPNVIQLKRCEGDGLLKDRQAFFIIRAPSWKMLLRALAWYGNTRVEGGPEEVADATGALKMRVEVEFVTPTKVEVTNGGGAGSQRGWKGSHVSLCMSLIQSASSPDGQNALSTALKQSSRSLDSTYLRCGSARRVITLPSQAPSLPLPMVRLAQHLHQAHVFSAACPSTSHTALHSPRDLTRAIDRHDVNYLGKLQRLRRDAGDADVPHEEEGTQLGRQEGDEGRPNDDLYDAGAVEEFEGVEGGPSTMSRMRARVRRKLAKRSGESNAVDQDLESWITPFDVNQHG